MASKGSKTEFVVKLVLVFFISLLAFSVGTFVGKSVSDSDYRRAALEGELNPNRSTASHGEDGKAEGSELSHEEVASLTEEFIEGEKEKMEVEATGDHPAATDQNIHEDEADNETSVQASKQGYKKFGDKTAAPTVAHAAPTTAKAIPSKEVAKKIETRNQEVADYKKTIAAKPAAADQVAANKPATTGKPEVRTPSSVLPSVASSAIGKYTVQIASYATEAEAKGHASKLEKKGYQAFYIPAEISGKTWYRVSVGLFKDAVTAKNFQEELSKEANITTSIVQKIVK